MGISVFAQVDLATVGEGEDQYEKEAYRSDRLGDRRAGGCGGQRHRERAKDARRHLESALESAAVCAAPAGVHRVGRAVDEYGQYTGHDEPSALFYSTVPGSGNSSLYRLTLPTDPVAAPLQNGTGSTWNFQLHPAFWFGMIMCDDQAAPNPGVACPAGSDKNIFKSTNPHSADYIGLTPGTAFMEMQFYPPGWGPVSCTDAVGNQDGKWCAALNIDSVQSNSNTGAANNDACNGLVGPEPVNYAIITKSGVPVAPARPDTGFGNQAVVTSDTLEFNNGDKLVRGHARHRRRLPGRHP